MIIWTRNLEDFSTDQLRVERWRLYYLKPKGRYQVSKLKQELRRINEELYKRTGNEVYLLYKISDGN